LKIYADLTGNRKKQRIKSLCDNKVKVDAVVALINAVYLLDVNEILNDGGGWGAQVI